MAHRYARDQQEHPLRKTGKRALYVTQNAEEKEAVFARVVGPVRDRIDAIRCNDGDKSLGEMIKRLVELYDFMMGRRPEPTWLPRVQQEYRLRQQAEAETKKKLQEAGDDK